MGKVDTQLTGIELWGVVPGLMGDEKKLAEMRRGRHPKGKRLDKFKFSNFGEKIQHEPKPEHPELLLWLISLGDQLAPDEAHTYFKSMDEADYGELDLIEDFTAEQLATKFGIPAPHAAL